MVDFLFQLAPVQQRRPRSYGFNANLLNYSDEEHRARYRFGRESIENITNLRGRFTAKNRSRSPVFLCQFSEVGKFFLCCGGQIFPFIPNFLDSAIGHPYSIYRLRYLQPRSILLCVCDAIAISENLDLIRSSFSSTFSVNTVISGRIKLFFLVAFAKL